jgi:small membrane protein
MNIIKVILVVSFLGAMVWAFRNRGRVGIRAGARIIIVLITLVAIASIIAPNIPQRVADFVGVTRGTDLVLYLLVIVFVLTSVGTYFRFRDLERRFVDLVRASAIQNAVAVQGSPASIRDPDRNPPR